MTLRLAEPLMLALLLAPAFFAPAAAADPSFDCRTAKTARELATCGDAKLAAADRELAAAWRDAIARLDPVTAKVLREDQRKFLSDIDDGFDAELWGKQDRPEGKELRAQVAQLRRGGRSFLSQPATTAATARPMATTVSAGRNTNATSPPSSAHRAPPTKGSPRRRRTIPTSTKIL